MQEQDRINALISYFFLWPLFLLAKKDTPLAAPYVQRHAWASSKIIGLTFVAIIIYFFLRGYIGVSVLGIDIRTVVVTAIMGTCSAFLIRGAYRAYHTGDTTIEQNSLISDELLLFHTTANITPIDTDEDRIRIFASHIPYVGILLAAKYDHPLMVRARIVSSGFMTIFLLLLFIGSGESFFAFLTLILYIIFVIVEGVSIFLSGRYLSYALLDNIPSYREVEAHIIAGFGVLYDFIRVIFGKTKTETYSERFEAAKNNNPESPIEVVPYFMPRALIGLPIWNLFTMPSFFIAQYRPYRSLILQWLIITLILIFGYIFMRGDSVILLLLLFPIVHIFAYAQKDIMTRTPIIGLLLRIGLAIWEKKKTITSIEKSEKWSYETWASPPTEAQKIESK